MDPLSATASVLAIISASVKTAKALNPLRNSYKKASITITTIYSESMVISASLSQLQTLLLRDANTINGHKQHRSELLSTFDTALTGCMVVFSCLDEEIRRLAVGAAERDSLAWKDKAAFVWKEDVMKELLQSIRGQQTALSLLIQGLQLESLTDIKRLLQDNNEVLQQVAHRSRSLRASNPRVKVPDSVFEQSIELRGDANSTTSHAEFDFDDLVVDSKVYRRAMAVARMRSEKDQASNGLIEGDLIDLTEPGDDLIPEPIALSTLAKEFESINIPRAGGSATDSAEQAQCGARSCAPFANIANVDDPELEKPPLPSRPSQANSTASRPTSLRSNAATPAHTPTANPNSVAKDEYKKSEEGRSEEPLEARPSSDYRFPTVATKDASSPATCPPSVFSRSSGDSRQDSLSDMTAVSSLGAQNPGPEDPANGFWSTISTFSIFGSNHGFRPPVAAAGSVYDFMEQIGSDIADVRLVSTGEIERHNVWQRLLQAEERYGQGLKTLAEVFYNPISKKWPVLAKHLEIMSLIDNILKVNHEFLLLPLQLQLSSGPFAPGQPELFQTWSVKARSVYLAYFQRFPHAESSVSLTLEVDLKFGQFVDELRLNPRWGSLNWNALLQSPISQLSCYENTLELLSRLVAQDPSPPTKDQQALELDLSKVANFKSSCQTVLENSARREAVQTLFRRIHTINSRHLEVLDMSNPDHQIIQQGPLAVRVRGKGPWLQVYGVLINNCLFWGKEEGTRATYGSRRKLWLLEEPMSLKDLSIQLPSNGAQPVKASLLDDVPRGSELFPFVVKSVSIEHTLSTTTLEERDQWLKRLHSAVDGQFPPAS